MCKHASNPEAMMLESPSWAQTIAAVILRFQVLGRIKRSDGRPKYDQAENEPGHWGVLIAPVPEYLENGGPIPVTQVAWVELKLTRTVHRGRLIPDVQEDVSALVLPALQGLNFVVDLEQNTVRVFPEPQG
jgi:hypothetical protein